MRDLERSRRKTEDLFGEAVGDSLYICCAVHSEGLSAKVYFDREACSGKDRVRGNRRRGTAGRVGSVVAALMIESLCLTGEA